MRFDPATMQDIMRNPDHPAWRDIADCGPTDIIRFGYAPADDVPRYRRGTVSQEAGMERDFVVAYELDRPFSDVTRWLGRLVGRRITNQPVSNQVAVLHRRLFDWRMPEVGQYDRKTA